MTYEDFKSRILLVGFKRTNKNPRSSWDVYKAPNTVSLHISYTTLNTSTVYIFKGDTVTKYEHNLEKAWEAIQAEFK